MTEWKTLSKEERKQARAKFQSDSDANLHASDTYNAVLLLLKEDPEGRAAAGKLTYGNYLINHPLDIAAHCQTVPMEIGREDVFYLFGSWAFNGGKYSPKGLFYTHERTMSGDPVGWAAIDNSTGNGWEAAFETKESCIQWLTRGGNGRDA